MTICSFNLNVVHPSWKTCLEEAINKIPADYLQALATSSNWLPGNNSIFNAFSLPIDQVNYVLLGESPYPRAESANGFAFWDAAVNELWSPQGLSKKVNRATSLRNIIKMLLIAENLLAANDTSQAAIAKLDKTSLIQFNHELFNNLLAHGFLLLNATPVLQENGAPQKDARIWQVFLDHVIQCLLAKRPDVTFILLGNIANAVDKLIPEPHTKKFYAEHPYNLTFITNKTVLDFFRPLHLLRPSMPQQLDNKEVLSAFAR